MPLMVKETFRPPPNFRKEVEIAERYDSIDEGFESLKKRFGK